MPSESIVERARGGEQAAAATVARYCHRMARALAAVINLIDPDVIVLGGGMSNIAAVYDEVPRLWAQWVFRAGGEEDAVRTRLARARHGDASGVRGAAWLWP
jgi:predicted NBD/HSP70 family sugar kinase